MFFNRTGTTQNETYVTYVIDIELQVFEQN